ncbi:hypothetical protein HYR99_12485 [Candidatus Poribacteria bacterium]|nr:hypothetical protein [Candidatus Poribacteria bacterium]
MNGVVFTHLPIQNWDRFETAWMGGTLPQMMASSWSRTIQAYEQCNNIELVYLFLSDAYVASITNNPNANRRIALEDAIQTAFQSVFPSRSGKFEVVGWRQLSSLIPPLEQLASNSRPQPISLNQLLLGAGSQLHYDCPKVVEAIIRVARRDNPGPILRFDADVSVGASSVQHLLDHYENLRSNNIQLLLLFGELPLS